MSTNKYVTNPKTGRAVKVGNRAWLSLVKEGLISGEYQDPNELDIIQDKDTEEQINEKIKELNKELPSTVSAVKGRGKYKGKIVKRNKQMSYQDIVKQTSKLASQVSKRSKPREENNLEKDI